MALHQLHKPADHIGHDNAAWHCSTCEGGLSYCKVCTGAEGSLPTDCPGRPMTMSEEDAVYAGKLDYKDPDGWVTK